MELRNRLFRNISATLLMLATLSSITFASPQYRKIIILHTNDTHGHLIPFSYPDPPTPDLPGTTWPKIYRNIGGIARRATLVKRIESEQQGNVILIDAGDQLDGTPFSIEYMGEADCAAMKTAGYDLKTLGNHEFSANLAKFKQNLKTAGFPTLCANLREKSTRKLYQPQYTIMDFDGVKVAFFGLTIPTPTYPAAKEGYMFDDPVETAANLVPGLREHADIVIAITHIGEDKDEELAKKVPGIDAIIGGHSHTRLAQPVFIKNSDAPSPYKIGGTVIVQDGQWGQELGKLQLCLRKNGSGPYTLMSYKGELLPVTSDIPEDPATARVLARYLTPIWKKYGEQVGEATASFVDSQNAESSVMNLVCDATREVFKADVALCNNGGVRDNIATGSIRMWDIACVLPFANTMMTAQMDGKRLKEALRRLKPGVSGARYVIERNQLLEATVNDVPIEDLATYKVVTNSWFTENGLEGTKWTDTGITTRDAVKQYIKSKGKICPVIDGRRVIKGSGLTDKDTLPGLNPSSRSIGGTVTTGFGSVISSSEICRHLTRRIPVDTSEVADMLSVNQSTAHRLVDDFIRLGILKETTGYKRNRIFGFDRYLKLFE